MSILEIAQWLQDLPLAQQVRESDILFPYLSIAHVAGLALAGGSIAYLDLRLLGFGLKHAPVSRVAASLLPCMWTGWILMLISGSLILISEAVMLYDSWFFRAKFIMMALAGMNALAFHFTVFRKVADWDLASTTPLQARITGALSLTLWMGMIAAGRLVPYYAK